MNSLTGWKKRLLALGAAAVLVLLLLPARATAATESITVYNWGQYISDGTDGYIDVNKAFTEATGIQVNYVTFDSNETLYTKLKTGGSSYDVIIPSDYMIGRLADEGMLEELDFSNIPNYQYIDEAYRNTSYDAENKYSVPYTWGTVGIIYNKKFVDEADLGSWDLLWNEKYAGKILMFDNPRDAFAVGELLTGSDVNAQDSSLLQIAAEKLAEEKPLVQSYVMDQIYDKMENEEAWIAPYYAGDYLMMVEENENLGFYFPQEGFNLFIDAMCIPKGCKNKAAAEAYINFLCDPEICAENLEYLGYSAPETAAREKMDPDVAESEIAYPDETVLSQGQSFNFLPTAVNQEMDSLWLEVKTGSIGTGKAAMGASAWALLAVIAAVVVYCLVRAQWIRRRKARRCRKWKQ